MLQQIGNVLDEARDPQTDAICITTNGSVTKNGYAVMGAGIAAAAASKWPMLKTKLAKAIQKGGNHTHFLMKTAHCCIFSFPTKPGDKLISSVYELMPYYRVKIPTNQKWPIMVPGWQCPSDLQLIVQAARELVQHANARDLKRIVLPPPGCSHGGLPWDTVERHIEKILDDRFIVSHYNPNRPAEHPRQKPNSTQKPKRYPPLKDPDGILGNKPK